LAYAEGMPDEVRLDREVVARIISRASELASPARSMDSFGVVDELDCIDEQSLIEAAREVGLPIVAVRRSIAFEYLGAVPDHRFGDHLLGGPVLLVDGEIAGSAHDVLERVDAWLVDGHHLRRDRLRDGRGEWSKRSGVVGVTVRHLRTATGEGRLGEHRRVSATAHDIGTGSTVIRVAVDRSAERRRSAAGGVVVIVGGTSGLIAAAVASAPLILLAAPVVVLGGIGVALTGRSRAARTVNEVERMLEAVADHESPTRLRNEVARRVTGRHLAEKRARRAADS
jgi:hypothetical protein